MPQFAGHSRFETDAKRLAAASSDFGGVVRKVPQAVVRPASTQEVVEIVRERWRTGRPLSIRGAAHSAGGQCLSDDGLVMEMNGLDRIGELEGDSIRVQGGVLWRDLVRHVQSRGYLPRVLTTNLDLTVGGTLSVAGLGASSHLYGAQSDNVTELQAVTGEGCLLRCSPTENKELFDCARCGLGQFSLITESRIRLRKAAPQVCARTVVYGEIEPLLRDLQSIVLDDRFHYISAHCLPRTPSLLQWAAGEPPFSRRLYRVDIAVERNSDLSCEDALDGLACEQRLEAEDLSVEQFIARTEYREEPCAPSGGWRLARPWMEGILPWQEVASYVSETLGSLPPAIATASLVHLAPFRRSAFQSPLFMLPKGEFLMGFGILPAVNPRTLATVLPMLDNASRRLAELGGKRYLSGWVNYDHEQWQTHYGELWPQLLKWKETFDPKNILSPGFIRYGPT